MNKEQVSIVVPVYNAEEFLDRCIQSLPIKLMRIYRLF